MWVLYLINRYKSYTKYKFMNLKIVIPKTWEPYNSISFFIWYKIKLKSIHQIDEDFNILKHK